MIEVNKTDFLEVLETITCCEANQQHKAAASALFGNAHYQGVKSNYMHAVVEMLTDYKEKDNTTITLEMESTSFTNMINTMYYLCKSCLKRVGTFSAPPSHYTPPSGGWFTVSGPTLIASEIGGEDQIIIT